MAAHHTTTPPHSTAGQRPAGGPAPLPVNYSVLSADALRQQVATAYALDQLETCQLVRPGRNDTYLLTAGPDRYIARVYGVNWRSRSEIQYELDLLLHLAGHDVSVSVPIPDRTGGLLSPLPAPEGLRFLVLFSYAEGRPLDWSKDGGGLAGQVAARIHSAAADFASEEARPPLDLQQLLQAPLAVLRPFLQHRPADLEYVEQYVARLHARLAAAVGAGLDWGVCHGDLGNRNIHITDGGQWIAIDFDLCGPGWRAYDFVAAQWMAAYEQRRDIWEDFVRGYTSIRPLSAADIAAVSLFQGASRLWTVGLGARNVSRWGTVTMSDWYLDSHLESLRHWQQWEQDHPDWGRCPRSGTRRD